MTQNALEAAMAAFNAAGGDMTQLENLFSNAGSPIGQDRLVRKETSLGAIRQLDPPMEHIGDQLAPWKDVPHDDVIFEYLTVDTDGLAPARAEDAEAELAQKDDTVAGQGRASIIDWSLKDHYDASDVNRARELMRIVEAMKNGNLPLLAESGIADWNAKVARDRVLRRRKLDNRREQLIMDAQFTNVISYNDGRIKFNVPYGRPADQQAGNAAFDVPAADIVDGVWDISGVDFDPIRHFNEVDEFMYTRYGVRLGKVIGPKKVLNSFWRSEKFSQRAGLGAAYTASGQPTAPDLLYAASGWSPAAARGVIAASTGLEFQEYDSVYRTRAPGSKTITTVRFSPSNRLLYIPKMDSLGDLALTEIGFGKTLTSPHPEGNWTSGFYEWEKSRRDPWGQDVGNGVKMFPVFPHQQFTLTVDVNLPA